MGYQALDFTFPIKWKTKDLFGVSLPSNREDVSGETLADHFENFGNVEVREEAGIQGISDAGAVDIRFRSAAPFPKRIFTCHNRSETNSYPVGTTIIKLCNFYNLRYLMVLARHKIVMLQVP